MFDTFFQVFVFLLGLALGSFLNVVIYRLPRDDVSISNPRRSACPRCGGAIAWYDNLPLISWILLRGRCRHCRQPISIRYPLVELICGLLVLGVYYRHYPLPGFRALAEVYFVLGLVALSFIDLDHLFIPDEITLPGMLIGLTAAVVSPDLWMSGPWLTIELARWGRSLTGLTIIWGITGFILVGTVFWIFDRFYDAWRGEALEPEPTGSGDAEDEEEPPRLGVVLVDFLGRRTVIALPVIFVLLAGGLAAGMVAAPDRLARALGWLLYQTAAGPSLIGSVWGLAMGGGVVMGIFALYLVVRRMEGMGLGDLTLLAMIGAFLGWRSIFFCIFGASIIALLAYMGMAVKAGKFDLKEMLPFGPFLSLAALVYLFFGQRFLHWYLG